MNDIEAELIGTISRGIESVEKTVDGDIVFTMTDGERINIGSVTHLPRLTLEWTYEPDDSIKAGNVAAVLKATQSPGAYDIRIKKGSAMIPALTVTANSVMGISLQDGASLRAYQFTGTSVRNYRQITWSYINVGEFDDMSESAASQMSIAEYVEGKLADNTSAITVRGEDPALPVPAQILTESQDAALTPEERAARVLYFVVEDDPEGT